MTKRIYLILYLISFIAYIVYVPFYAYIVNNRVTFHTAYLASIVKNQPGGQRAYNIYLLTNKNYRLSRSKGILGSVLSSKEISQFDVKAINDRSSEIDIKDSSRLISFYIDKPIGKSKSVTPIGLRKGDNSDKDSWYYFTLLGYVSTYIITVPLLIVQVLLAMKCSRLYKKSKLLWILYISSVIFLLLFGFVF